MKHIIKTNEVGAVSQEDIDTILKDASQHKDRAVSIEVKKYFAKRSDAQNRYWWGVIVELVSVGLLDTGNEFARDKNKVHEYLKKLFLSETLDVVSNEGELLQVEITRSTTDLSSKEFMQVKEQIQQWSAEFLGVDIPDPKENIETESKKVEKFETIRDRIEPNKIYYSHSITFNGRKDIFQRMKEENYLIPKGNGYIRNNDKY